MKNLPDKIYVQLPSRKWIGRTWDETPIKEGDNPNWKNATNIEYVRKDAFIEKAVEWLTQWDKYRVCLEGRKDWFIEQFKKAMKEEPTE